MFRKSYLFDLPCLLLSFSLISGCYTVVMHQKNIILPEADETGSEPQNYSHSIDISIQSSCSSCHSNNLDYNEMNTVGGTFGSSSLWAYYYDTNVPWWVSQNNAGESGDDIDAQLGDTGMRRYYGRRREALNNDNASSSITPTTDITTGGGAVIPSFPSSIPTFGGTITTTITNDSALTQNTDSVQTDQAPAKNKSQNKRRDYGLRKDAKKK